MYEIEKGRSIPPKSRGPGQPETAYPFRQMKEGDSFFVKEMDNRDRKQIRSISARASTFGKETNQRFTIRRDTKDGEVGWRVFHIGPR